LGFPEAELSLTLVSDRAMARLNRETFGRRGPTNVIAFPVDAGGGSQGAQPPALSSDIRERDLKKPVPPVLTPSRKDRGNSEVPPHMLGEVVISVETTLRQAKENGWPWEELFDFYLIHGILHLLCYDHDTPEAETAMTAKTWALMKVLSDGGD
jgi:probable rRNA maturation factor